MRLNKMSRSPRTRFGAQRRGKAGRGIAAAALLACASSALAIQPGQWVHTTEADFVAGESQKTVVTNLGDVKLAVGSELIAETPEKVTIINDVQVLPDGAFYLAGGPEAMLLRQADGKLDTLLELKDEQVFALDVLDGKLLLGISGENSRLAVLEGDQLVDVITLEGTRYIWDMLVVDQSIYLATGNEGQLLRVDLAPGQPATSKVLFDTPQANVLCLGRDGQGRIYMGTDTHGLVYRVTLEQAADAQPQVFVLYDAPEPEIGALLVQPDGTVFVGTADAEQARPGRLSEAVSQEKGRPGAAEVEPAVEPEQPVVEPPPELPNVPPEPEPLQPDGAAPAGAPALQENGAAEEDDTDAAAQPQEQARRAAIELQQNDASENQPAGEAPVADAAAAEPTQAQRDRLRDVIRQRLEQARRDGELQVAPRQAQRPVRAAPGAPGGPATARRPGASAAQGNAIYRIGPNGFVSEVFRESVMILRLIDDQGRLLVATGNEGELYSIDPVADETTIIADIDPQQITSVQIIGQGADRWLMAATSNPGQLIRLDPQFAAEGIYTSSVLDAGQISLWGAYRVTADVPANSSVVIESRSGNVEDPEQAAWSEWSEAQVLEHDPAAMPLVPREFKLASPPARFLQYRLTLKGDGSHTPTVGRVELAYVTPNLKPSIVSIQSAYAGQGASGARGGARPAAAQAGAAGPQHILNLSWEAADPNGDALRYQLEMRAAGSDVWIPLAKDLDQNSFEWDTRQAPDGWYLIRLTASDAPDNTPDMALSVRRQSDPVLVDNTPPVLVAGPVADVRNGVAVVRLSAADRLSSIRDVRYSIDGDEQWKATLPTDLIYDSTNEEFAITISDLAPGPHVVSLRVTDAQGNALYHAVTVEVP